MRESNVVNLAEEGNEQASKSRRSRRFEQMHSQKGYAMIVALLIIVAFIILAVTASQTVSAISREAQRAETMRQEKARAEYYLSMAEATLKYDVRDNYNNLQISGKQQELQQGGSGKLPMFDALTSESSRPLLNLDGSLSGESAASATSLYGATSGFAVEASNISRNYIVSKFSEKNITQPDSLEIISFQEAYRRSMPGVTEPIYAFRYLIRARAGQFGDAVREDTILLGPAILEDAPPPEDCSDLLLTGLANPANVNWGESSTLELNYTRAEHTTIYNSGGMPLIDQDVANESAPAMISYNTGSLTSAVTYVGEAVRGLCKIQVPITVGVSFNQSLNYTVNGAQSVNIIEGDPVRYDWSVNNASSGYTTSWITYSSDTGQYYPNIYANSINVPGPSQSITSTLHVKDSRLNGGAEQSATVTINVCRRPQIISFNVNPTSVTQGGNQTVQFSWQTQNAAGVRIVRLSDNQVIYSGSQGTGNFAAPQPQAGTQYRLEAVSDCGAASASNDVGVAVQPPACSLPVINLYTVNPASVNQGENNPVTFNWNVSSSCPVSISIDHGVGSSLGLNGQTTINQPQVTTIYTITATNSAGSASQPQTVTVIPPIPNSCGQYPGYGEVDAKVGGGGGGRMNQSGNTQSYDAEVRYFYKVEHHTDNTYRFNFQLYVSQPNISTTPTQSGSQYLLSIGNLRVKRDPNGLEFYDQSGNYLMRANWENKSWYPASYNRDIGYTTYSLVGDYSSSPGLTIPFSSFDFSNDIISFNNPIIMTAYTIPYNPGSFPAQPLNVTVSGGSLKWQCP